MINNDGNEKTSVHQPRGGEPVDEQVWRVSKRQLCYIRYLNKIDVN